MNQNHRIYGLDILRAIAILSVIYDHSYYLIDTHVNAEIYKSLAPDGVSIFFVLSGFLIGSILIRNINYSGFDFQDLSNFWVRRWFRTLPAYFCMVACIALYRYVKVGSIAPLQYVKYTFFLQALKDGAAPLYPESWSLCVEEWFYLSVPLLLFLSFTITKINRAKVLLFWIVSIIILITLYRIYTIHLNHYNSFYGWDTYLRKATLMRIDGIMYGVLGAYLNYHQHKIWKKENLLFIIGIGLFVLLSIETAYPSIFFYSYFKFPLEALATLLLIPKLLRIKTGNGFLYAFFTFVSTISYSIYLLNYTPFNEWILPRLNRVMGIRAKNHIYYYDLIRLIVFLIWSVVSAYLLYRIVEKPAMNRRKNFSKREYKGGIISTKVS